MPLKRRLTIIKLKWVLKIAEIMLAKQDNAKQDNAKQDNAKQDNAK